MISGCVGPRGDGYQPGVADDRRARPRPTTPSRSGSSPTAGADLVTAITMTHAEEAIGVARAARGRRHARASCPSPSRPTAGCPRASRCGDAVAAVDAATGGGPAYYMVNCAHPTHFDERCSTTTLAGADPRRPGQRLDAEPRRAGRGRRTSTPATRRLVPATPSCARACRTSPCWAAAAEPTHRHISAIGRACPGRSRSRDPDRRAGVAATATSVDIERRSAALSLRRPELLGPARATSVFRSDSWSVNNGWRSLAPQRLQRVRGSRYSPTRTSRRPTASGTPHCAASLRRSAQLREHGLELR